VPSKKAEAKSKSRENSPPRGQFPALEVPFGKVLIPIPYRFSWCTSISFVPSTEELE